jgi:hypothetical protein
MSLFSIIHIYFCKSDEALRLEQEKQEKSTRLEQRRSHLSAILEAEKTQFQVEFYFQSNQTFSFLNNSD